MYVSRRLQSPRCTQGRYCQMPIFAAASNAEEQIFNEVVHLLVRQRDASVSGALIELKAQLEAIYQRKMKDVVACQMGLGLANLGLGDHAEAFRLIANAQKIAPGVDYVVGNAIVAFVNMGYFEDALKLANTAVVRFEGDQLVLRAATLALESTLHFEEASQSIDNLLKFAPDANMQASLVARQALLAQLAARGKHDGFDGDSLMARAQCAVECLKRSGKQIFSIDLRGVHVNSVALELSIDASPQECAELNYVVAEALFDNFEDATAVDLVTFSVRSFVGASPLSTFADSRVIA